MSPFLELVLESLPDWDLLPLLLGAAPAAPAPGELAVASLGISNWWCYGVMGGLHDGVVVGDGVCMRRSRKAALRQKLSVAMAEKLDGRSKNRSERLT